MNPWLLGSLADSRCREIRREAAPRVGGFPRPGSSPASGAHWWPRMRRQVGYALVEAGLRLLATAGPAPRG
jgi:hypothetical protein